MWDLATLVNALHSPKRHIQHWVIIVQHHGESGTLQLWIYRVNSKGRLHYFDITGYFFELYNTCDRKKARKTTQMLPPAQIMVVAYLWVGLSLHIIPKCALRRIRCPRQLLSPFGNGCTYLPKGQAPKFSHGWLKISSLSGYNPTMVGWNIGGRVHRKSSAREETTHPSATPVIKQLNLGSIHRIRVKAFSWV